MSTVAATEPETDHLVSGVIAWVVGGIAVLIGPTPLLLGVVAPALTPIPPETARAFLVYGGILTVGGVCLLSVAGYVVGREPPFPERRAVYTWPILGLVAGLLPASVYLPFYTHPILWSVTVPIASILFLVVDP